MNAIDNFSLSVAELAAKGARIGAVALDTGGKVLAEIPKYKKIAKKLKFASPWIGMAVEYLFPAKKITEAQVREIATEIARKEADKVRKELLGTMHQAFGEIKQCIAVKSVCIVSVTIIL